MHRSEWPDADRLLQLAGDDADSGILAVAREVIGGVRKAKSTAKTSMRSEVTRLDVTAAPEALSRVAAIQDDVRGAGHILAINLIRNDDEGELKLEVVL